MKKITVLLSVLLFISVVVILLQWTGYNNLSSYAAAVDAELSKAKIQLTTISSDLSLTKNRLATTNAQLSDTKNQLTTANAELSQTKNKLVITNTELDGTKQILQMKDSDLSKAKNDLNQVNTELVQTKNTLSQTSTELTSTKQELSNTKILLSSTQNSLTQAQNSLTSLSAIQASSTSQVTTLTNTLTQVQNQLDNANTTLRGLGITVRSAQKPYEGKTVDIIENRSAVNPTWFQLKSFLSADTTFQHTYIADVYDCTEFARDIHNNAESWGLKCSYVQVGFYNSRTGHAVVAFATTDYGLVYVDCQGQNEICRIEKGRTFRALGDSQVGPSYVRNNTWWDSNGLLYWYFTNDLGGDAVTSQIIIYW